MKHKSFSVFDAAGHGFRLTFKNIGLFFVVGLIWIGFGIAYQALMALAWIGARFFAPGMQQMMQMQQQDPMAMMKTGFGALLKMGLVAFVIILVVFLISALVGLALRLGYTQILFDVHDKKKSRASRLFSCFGLLGKYIGASILLSLIFLGVFVFSMAVGWVFALIAKPFGLFVSVVLASVLTLILAVRLHFVRFFIVDKDAGPMEALNMSFYATRGHFWRLFCAMLLAPWMMITIIGIPATGIMFTSIYRKIT